MSSAPSFQNTMAVNTCLMDFQKLAPAAFPTQCNIRNFLTLEN